MGSDGDLVGCSGEGLDVRIIVGLGNPGAQYAGTRHNIGFRVAEALAGSPNSITRARFKALTGEADVGGERVLLLCPQTFMNRSGESVVEALRFYQEDASRLIVVHDEADLAFGTLRIKLGGGAAGHNGLKSLIASLGTPEFLRIRVGIGRSDHPGKMVGHVLGAFSELEQAMLPDVLSSACGAVTDLIQLDPARAMSRWNTRST